MRRRFIPELDRREALRVREHIPCSVMVHGKRHSGVVRNLSAQGLYVEIHAALPLGAAAVVAFRTAEGKLFVLEASVPNQRLIPHSLKLLATGGVGLRLVDPPETYQRWLEGAGESAS